jgi:hypothetical protein
MLILRLRHKLTCSYVILLHRVEFRVLSVMNSLHIGVVLHLLRLQVSLLELIKGSRLALDSYLLIYSK